jgi:hypothetical protein
MKHMCDSKILFRYSFLPKCSFSCDKEERPEMSPLSHLYSLSAWKTRLVLSTFLPLFLLIWCLFCCKSAIFRRIDRYPFCAKQERDQSLDHSYWEEENERKKRQRFLSWQKDLWNESTRGIGAWMRWTLKHI